MDSVDSVDSDSGFSRTPWLLNFPMPRSPSPGPSWRDTAQVQSLSSRKIEKPIDSRWWLFYLPFSLGIVFVSICIHSCIISFCIDLPGVTNLPAPWGEAGHERASTWMFGDIKTSLCYQIPEKVKCDEMFFLPKTLQGPPLEGAEAAEAIWVARCKL